MILKNIFKKINLIKILIFIPVIFYFGKRSYIAFDEGFYALQARWILEKGNWTIPLWWDNYVLDRTIGLQFLIAKSQEIFGENIFSAYLPTTLAAILMLFITFKLHEELFGEKYALVSPLILSTTYLWFDYSHLATQDIIFACLVSTGVFSLVKVKGKSSNFYIFLFGIWIGLAFMMKTFLVALPLLSLLPHLFIKKNFILTKYFWLGLIIGFIPFLQWTISINSYLDKNIIFHLYDKLNLLSNQNTFSHPFYYYFWNIPITHLPWSFFAIIGMISNIYENKNKQSILTFFPLIFIFTVSFFSTKTPYYPLQISSILALNSFVGIRYIFNSKQYKYIVVFLISKIVPLLIISLAFIYYFLFKDISNFNLKENIFVLMGLTLLGLSWSLIKRKSTFNEVLIPIVLGPYLLTSCLLYSGLFTDRSRELREKMEYVSSLEIVKNQPIKVDTSEINNSKIQSKIIRIALQTPLLGESIEGIDKLKKEELAWSTKSKEKLTRNNSYDLIYEDEIFKPWKLILKK